LISSLSNTVSDPVGLSSNEKLFLNFFWGAFTVYAISNSLVENPRINEKFSQYLQLLSLVIIFTSFLFLARFKIVNNYLKLIFTIYFIWVVLIILRGIRLDFASIMYMLLSADYGVLTYFVPLIILFPKDLNFYKKIFNVIRTFSFLFFFGATLYLNSLLTRSSETKDVIEALAWYLALPSGFILLTYKYHSTTRKILALSTIVVSLLFSIYQARRGLSTILLSTLIFSFFSFILFGKQKVLVIYLAALLISLGWLYINSIYNISNNKLLSFIAQRGEEDTRTGVEVYFYNDMGTKDWIMGRGMNGTYYCPGIDDEKDYRTVIETGYLQIILKGGLIRLILYLLIMVPAVFLGLFSSKNILSKAAAFWIIIDLIALYPATVESFDFQYIIVWVSVGICYSKKIRNYSDAYINDFLKGNLKPSG
jgi:hypothetical protein